MAAPKDQKFQIGRSQKSIPLTTTYLRNELFDTPKRRATVGEMKSVLEKQGLNIEVDPRLQGFKEFSSSSLTEESSSFIRENEACGDTRAESDLIIRALRNQLAVRSFDQFTQSLKALYDVAKRCNKGEVFARIPQLAKQKRTLWGLSLCSVDGQMFDLGDYQVPFTLQGCIKPLLYGLAVEKLGHETVLQYVGVENMPKEFNTIELNHESLPPNPMINSGAIMICCLLHSLVYPYLDFASLYSELLNFIQSFIPGEPLKFNNAAYISEKMTPNRNRAIAYYMKHKNIFPSSCNFKKCLDLYTQMCCMETTTKGLGQISATLANAGTHPLTRDKLLSPGTVKSVLSVMNISGMSSVYGEFAFSIGLPAKSSVSGGVILVVPATLGIGLFSPLINSSFCSVRALCFIKTLVNNFNFHPFEIIYKSVDNDGGDFKPKEFDNCSLMRAAATNDVVHLKKLLSKGCSLCVTDCFKRTPLHMAAAKGHLDAVEFLLRNSPSLISLKDLCGRTALDDAVFFRREEVKKYIASVTETPSSVHD